MTRARLDLGATGEGRAAAWYRDHGYQVVDRNWRCADGELDLICSRDELLVICEVKTRSSLAYGHPAEAVTPAKQLRIRRLAGRWLEEAHGSPPAKEVRFDVAAVLPTSVEVIEAAF